MDGTTSTTTPASIVGLTNDARVAASVSATVSPDTAAVMLNTGVTPSNGSSADGDGSESVAEVPLPVVVNA